MMKYINFSNSQSDKASYLFNTLNQLKQIVNDPEDFIWEHFQNMKNIIDLEYKLALKGLNDESEELIIVWTQKIEIIDKFQTECLQKIHNNSSYLNNSTEKIKKLEFELNMEMKNKSIFDVFTNEKNTKLENFKQLIATTEFNINKKLFSNKTLLYMNREECQHFKRLNDFKKPNHTNLQDRVGRLVLVNDCYVDIDYIYSFKKNVKAQEPTGFFQDRRTLDINADLLKSNILNDHLLTYIKTKKILEIDLKKTDIIDLSINRLVTEDFCTTNRIFLNMNFNSSNLFEEFNSLNTLIFKCCQIKSISFDILDCLSSNLTVLDLYDACKNVGYLKLISKLKNLVKLDLGSNYISILESTTFDHMIKLEHLKLRANSIKCLKKKCFKNLTNLKLIDLSVNQLAHLPEDLFQYNTKLEVIMLSNNRIEKLQYQFNNLKELKTLSLACNRFKSIDKNVFKNFKKLELLSLAGNEIKNLNGIDFKDLNINCKIYLEFDKELNRNI